SRAPVQRGGTTGLSVDLRNTGGSPWSGPVVAAVVIPPDVSFPSLLAAAASASPGAGAVAPRAPPDPPHSPLSNPAMTCRPVASVRALLCLTRSIPENSAVTGTTGVSIAARAQGDQTFLSGTVRIPTGTGGTDDAQFAAATQVLTSSGTATLDARNSLAVPVT